MSLLRFCTLNTKCFINKGSLVESIFTGSHTAGYSSGSSREVEKDKMPLRKAKTPQGKFDLDENDSKPSQAFEKFPDDVNPYTKEKGGPRGPEPTRYGDWERKGRCIDF